MCIKFEWNLSSGIRNKLRTNCVYGQTDGQTDGQGDSNIPPPPNFVAGGIIIIWSLWGCIALDITYIKIAYKIDKYLILRQNVTNFILEYC
jgi:hypothetical protein